MKGMTAKNSPCGEPTARRKSVATQRLRCVDRAARVKAADSREPGRDPGVVPFEEGGAADGRAEAEAPEPLHALGPPLAAGASAALHSVRSTAPRSRSKAGCPDETAPRRTIMMRSTPIGRFDLLLRNHSRVQRFARLRITALPTLVLAVIPSRVLPVGLCRQSARTLPREIRPTPSRIASKSERARSRTRARKACARPAGDGRGRAASPAGGQRPRGRDIRGAVYFSAALAASRFRPLARRRRMTAWPPLVLMRLRNPCVRLRRTLLGWYVRFTSCLLRKEPCERDARRQPPLKGRASEPIRRPKVKPDPHDHGRGPPRAKKRRPLPPPAPPLTAIDKSRVLSSGSTIGLAWLFPVCYQGTTRL